MIRIIIGIIITYTDTTYKHVNNKTKPNWIDMAVHSVFSIFLSYVLFFNDCEFFKFFNAPWLPSFVAFDYVDVNSRMAKSIIFSNKFK